jgi:acetyl-CoA acetyltransferase
LQEGRAAGLVENGGIAPGGKLPVNTNGGGLSCVHPGMYGVFTIIEAVRQLRGECGERQVPAQPPRSAMAMAARCRASRPPSSARQRRCEGGLTSGIRDRCANRRGYPTA